MKTPKRSYDPNLNHLIRAHYTVKGKERRARWKRKNRIKQLKNTIARQAEEIKHLRLLVARRILANLTAAEAHALEWARDNIVLRTYAPRLMVDRIDGLLHMCKIQPETIVEFRKGGRK